MFEFIKRILNIKPKIRCECYFCNGPIYDETPVMEVNKRIIHAKSICVLGLWKKEKYSNTHISVTNFKNALFSKVAKYKDLDKTT